MDSEKKKNIINFAIIILVIIGIYFHTLNQPWIYYDESMIYDEIAVPIPDSFGEIFEIIKSFGLFNNLSSSNYLYSSNTVTRTNFFGVPFLLFITFLFKKNAILYHCLNLFLHIINSLLVYLILKKCFSNFNFFSSLTTLLLTLIWAIHPVQAESVLLSTNIGATLSYTAFFLLFYDFIKNKDKNTKLSRKIILPICFLLPMLLNEYIIALPIILFAYSLITNIHSIKKTWEEIFPYLIGLLIYAVYFLFSSYKFANPSTSNLLTLFLERIFWLSPQIFIHYLKLIFFPVTLSLDQSIFIKLGKTILDPYSIFCFAFLLMWFILPIFIFIKNKKTESLLITTMLFFLSLLPFSQILSPTYSLCSERYLYTPLFFIIFGFVNILNHFMNKKGLPRQAPTRIMACCISLCIIIIVFCGVRTYIRTNDWKNTISLLESTIKTSPDFLHKGARTITLAESITKSDPKKLKLASKYFTEAQIHLYQAMQKYMQETKKVSSSPLILTSYGLDSKSLLIKTIYIFSLNAFSFDEKGYKKYLDLFNSYVSEIDSFDPKALEIYANLLVKDKQITKAKDIFLYAYKKYPTNPFILLSLIRFEKDFEKNLGEAKTYLRKALTLYPYSKEHLLESLKYYQLVNDLNNYVKYSYLYGLRTHSQFSYQEALAGFLMLNDLNSAKKTINKLLKTSQKDPNFLYLLSSYYYKKNDYYKAINNLTRAYSLIKLNPVNKQLAFNITIGLAGLYLTLGDNKSGTTYTMEALNFANNNPNNISKIQGLNSQYGI